MPPIVGFSHRIDPARRVSTKPKLEVEFNARRTQGGPRVTGQGGEKAPGCDRFGQAEAADCGRSVVSASRSVCAVSSRSSLRMAGVQLWQQPPAPQALRTSPKLFAPPRMTRRMVRSEIPLQWHTSIGVVSLEDGVASLPARLPEHRVLKMKINIILVVFAAVPRSPYAFEAWRKPSQIQYVVPQ